jgi:chromosome segregation ATPase
MSNILQWEPEKSRVWGNARMENVQRIREDLATLADWIRTKAESAALAGKADVSKLGEVQKALDASAEAVRALREELAGAAQKLEQQFSDLARRVDESGVEQQLQSIRDGQAQVDRNAEESKAAARQAEEARAQCAELNQALSRQAGEMTGAWEEARRTLQEIAFGVGQNAERVGELAQATQSALAECRSSAQEQKELRNAAQAEQAQISERLTHLLQETEKHAGNVAENVRLTTAACEAANALKVECEGLMESLRMKAEDLASSGESLHLELAGTLRAAAEDAARAAESAGAAQQAVQEGQQLRASILADQGEVQRQSASLQEKLEQADRQVATSGDHLQACQRLHAAVVEKDAQVRALTQTIEKQLQEAKAARDEVVALRQQFTDHLGVVRQEWGSFFGRLKWLMAGSRSGPS